MSIKTSICVYHSILSNIKSILTMISKQTSLCINIDLSVIVTSVWFESWTKYYNRILIDAVATFSQFVLIKLTFTAICHHNSLWPEARTLLKSQWGYLWQEATTVCCGQRPHYLKLQTGRIWASSIY